MATTALQPAGREVSLGRVFSRGFGTIGAYPFATVAIAFIFDILPALVVEAALVHLPGPVTRGWTIEASIILLTTNMVWSVLVQGMMALTVLAYSEGRRADIVDTLPPAFMLFFPLVLLGIINAFCVDFASLLLLIPGLILATMWAVAAPAMVVERLGPIAAFNRSEALTRGARWHVFGAYLILAVAGVAIEFAMRTIGMRQAVGAQIAHLPEMSGTLLLLFVVGILIRTAVSAVTAAVHGSFYVELRAWKEGPAVDALADVFS
jgi:hypothetical protein